MSQGPSANFRNALVIQDVNKAPEKVFKTNQKYQEYLQYLGKAGSNIPHKLAPQLKHEEVKLLMDPIKISPLLKSLTDENAILKNESLKQSTDIITLTSMVEKLIDDNTAIKKHLDLKQLEMQHFLEAKQLNITDEIADLKYQIQSLQDENNILIRHIEELRRNSSEEAINSLQTELSNANELYEQLQLNFQMCQEREQDLVRQISTLKPEMQQLQEEHHFTLIKLDAAEEQLDKANNQILLLNNNLEILQRTTNDKLSQKNIHLEEYQIKCNALLRDNSSLQDNLLHTQTKIQELCKENDRLLQEANSFQMISDELYSKGKDLKTQLELEKLKKPPTQSQQVLPQEKDFRLLHEQLEQAKLEYLRLDDFMCKQLEIQKNQSNQILDNMKMRYNNSLKEHTEQIGLLERQLGSANEDIAILKKDLEIKNQELNTLNISNNEYQQVKRMMDQQQMEIRILKNTVQDKKQLINEMLDEKDKITKIFKTETQVHSQQLQDLEQENKRMQIQHQKLPQLEIQIEKLNLERNELLEQNKSIQTQYKDIQNMCKELNQQNSQYKIDLGIAQNQINILKEQTQYFQQQQIRKDKLDQVLQENQMLRSQLNKQ